MPAALLRTLRSLLCPVPIAIPPRLCEQGGTRDPASVSGFAHINCILRSVGHRDWYLVWECVYVMVC